MQIGQLRELIKEKILLSKLKNTDSEFVIWPLEKSRDNTYHHLHFTFLHSHAGVCKKMAYSNKKPIQLGIDTEFQEIQLKVKLVAFTELTLFSQAILCKCR